MILAFADTVLAVLAFIIILGAIIIIHEGGHFFFAVRAGILCREYAFGMGPLIWKKKKGETTYSIRCLPIGGYCAICGEEAEDDPLKDLKQIRFDMENGLITKIYLPTDGKVKVNLFDDKPLYKMVSHDLYDKDDTGNLYIEIEKETDEVDANGEKILATEKIPVSPTAYYVYGIGKHNDETKSKEERLKKCVEEYQIGPHNRTLNSKSFWKRFMVLFGGPMMNFVLALVAFFISTLITGTSNTKSSKVAAFGYEDQIEEITDNNNYYNCNDVLGKAYNQEYYVYGYVQEAKDNLLTIKNEEGKCIKVRLAENQTVKESTFVLIKGTLIEIEENQEGCMKDVTIEKEVIIDSPLFFAGVREGDTITNLSYGTLNVSVSSWDDISSFMNQYSALESKGSIEVTYQDCSDNNAVKKVFVNPMVYIYSISMVQDITSKEVKIAELSEKSKAYEAGLRKGDEIKTITVKDETYTIKDWYDVYDAFAKATDGKTKVTLKVSREGETELLEFNVTPYSKELFDKTQSVSIVEMKMGVTCTVTRNIFSVVKATFVQMGTAIVQLFNTLGLLIFSSSVGVKDLSGPVGIFTMTKSAVSGGIGYLFYWLGFLSVNVGFMNLLPIPALDGGRILFLIIEKIKRKPLSQKVQDIAINATYWALLALIAYVTVNDILRLF